MKYRVEHVTDEKELALGHKYKVMSYYGKSEHYQIAICRHEDDADRIAVALKALDEKPIMISLSRQS